MTEVPPASPSPSPPSWRERIELLTQPAKATPTQVAGAVAAVVAVAVVGWLLVRPPPGPPLEDQLPRARSASSSIPTTLSSEVVVHAAGAVRAPGLYRLPKGSRVDDVIRAAGGSAPDADLDRINLAGPVADGARVYVPRLGEPAPSTVGEAGATGDASNDGPVNLNTATLEQLDALPGVGPATAKAILDARAKKGRFNSVEDLLAVRGIGPAKLDSLRDLVSV